MLTCPQGMLESDQPTNAAQVEALGVGKRLNASSSDTIVNDIRDAITHVNACARIFFSLCLL